MSTKITNCRIDMGHLEGEDFGPACHEGDWFIFSGQFRNIPGPFFSEAPRVIVTPILEDDIDRGAFPVCVVGDVSATGFTLAARNMAAHGFAAFNWLAVQETPGIANQVPNVSVGVLSPLSFGPVGDATGAQGGTRIIDDLNTASATVLLTATDHDVSGHSVAAVGVLAERFVEGVGRAVALAACNSDIVDGACAFNWARFPFNEDFVPGRFSQAFTVDKNGVPNSVTDVPQLEPSIETGQVSAVRFQASGQQGDWHIWDIRFTDPFSSAPVVLLTAQELQTTTEAKTAVVGIVQAVTPYGFRLAARNSDCGAGEAGFTWVAIGTL